MKVERERGRNWSASYPSAVTGPRSRPCPTCGAFVGEACISQQRQAGYVQRMTSYHPARKTKKKRTDDGSVS